MALFAVRFMLSISKEQRPDIVHINMQKKRKSKSLHYSKSNPDGFFFLFLAYVSLTDHKIRDFIARQLVSAQRWGGCSVFTVRDLLLVGVQPLQKRID